MLSHGDFSSPLVATRHGDHITFCGPLTPLRPSFSARKANVIFFIHNVTFTNESTSYP